MKPKTLNVLALSALLTILVGLGACGEKGSLEATRMPTPPERALGPAAVIEPEPASAGIIVPVVEQDAAFTYASAESQGLSRDALEELTDVVHGYLEEDAIVGAELVVIKNRRIVLHEAIGWKDRDDKALMEQDTIFNIRSMTKPMVGTAIKMLIDEGKLALEDRVGRFFPAFDNIKSREITTEHLLTHRSGLPLSVMKSFDDYTNIRDVADEAGVLGPDFEPGMGFQYSDAGSEVLGAVLEHLSGVTVDQFLEERITKPLTMHDTFVPLDGADPRINRIASAYLGTKGNWSRYWHPSDELIYAFALGSQSVYATPVDYARFLALWMDDGRAGEQQLLSPQAVRRGLTPVSDSGLPTNFPGLKVYYGQMWMLYVDADEDPEALDDLAPVAFGHNGSDGTFAWAWPDRDLMVLYFTQSRGQGSGIKLEKEIDRLLINPGSQVVVEVPEEYKPYLGAYTSLSGPFRYQQFTVLAQDGHLAVEVPGQIVVELEDPDAAGKWVFSIDDRVAVSFERDDAGDVVAMNLHEAGQTYELPKGTPPPEPELDPDQVSKYVGFYRREDGENIEVLIHEGGLAVKIPETPVILGLYPPDEEGKWYFRHNPGLAIKFNETEDGRRVESFTAFTLEGEVVRPRVEVPDSK